jgi:putative restriction endonuclease
MSALTTALSKVEGRHAAALNWFREHAGLTVPWSTMDDEAEKGVRLAARAKGIYKPSYTHYALSVRQTIDSSYINKDVIRRSDWSWVFPHHQENPSPAERDHEATNRGLMKCLNDGVPIGVLLQVKSKSGVEYEVLGLATVSEWTNNGYFILEGFSSEGERGSGNDVSDAAYDRAKAAVSSIVEFDPSDQFDTRENRLPRSLDAEVKRNLDQPLFPLTEGDA